MSLPFHITYRQMLASYILNKSLSQFIEKVSADQLSTSVIKTRVQIGNVGIKKTAISSMGFPIDVVKGNIESIDAILPFLSLSKKAATAKVENIFVLGRFSGDIWLLNDLMTNFSAHSDLQEIAEGKSTSKNNLMANMVMSVLNNLSINVDKVHIRLELEHDGMKIAAGVMIDTFVVSTVDENGVDTFNADIPDCLFKKAKMTGFSVYLDTNVVEINDMNFKEMMLDKKHDYILKDLAFDTRMEFGMKDTNEPYKVNVVVPKVDIMFDACQWRAVNAINSLANKLTIQRFNFMCARPNMAVLMDDEASEDHANVTEWWCFSYRVVRKKLYPHELDTKNALVFLKARKKEVTSKTLTKNAAKNLAKLEKKYGPKTSQMFVSYAIACNHMSIQQKAKMSLESINTDMFPDVPRDYGDAKGVLDFTVREVQVKVNVDSENPLLLVRLTDATGRGTMCANTIIVDNVRLHDCVIENRDEVGATNLFSLDKGSESCLQMSGMLDRKTGANSLNVTISTPHIYTDFHLIKKLMDVFDNGVSLLAISKVPPRDHRTGEIVCLLESHVPLMLTIHCDAPVITVPADRDIKIFLGTIDIKGKDFDGVRSVNNEASFYDEFGISVTDFQIVLGDDVIGQPFDTHISLAKSFIRRKSLAGIKIGALLGKIVFQLTQEQYLALTSLSQVMDIFSNGEAKAIVVEDSEIELTLATKATRDFSFDVSFGYEQLSVAWIGASRELFVMDGVRLNVSGIGEEMKIDTALGAIKVTSVNAKGEDISMFGCGFGKTGGVSDSLTAEINVNFGEFCSDMDLKVRLSDMWLSLDIPWIFRMLKEINPNPEKVRVNSRRNMLFVERTMNDSLINTSIQRQLQRHGNLKVDVGAGKTEVVVPSDQDIRLVWESISVTTPDRICRDVSNTNTYYDSFNIGLSGFALCMDDLHIMKPVKFDVSVMQLFVKNVDIEATKVKLGITAIELSMNCSQYANTLGVISMVGENMGSTTAPSRSPTPANHVPTLAIEFQLKKLNVVMTNDDGSPLNQFDIERVDVDLRNTGKKQHLVAVIGALRGSTCDEKERLSMNGDRVLTVDVSSTETDTEKIVDLDVQVASLVADYDIDWMQDVVRFFATKRAVATADIMASKMVVVRNAERKTESLALSTSKMCVFRSVNVLVNTIQVNVAHKSNNFTLVIGSVTLQKFDLPEGMDADMWKLANKVDLNINGVHIIGISSDILRQFSLVVHMEHFFMENAEIRNRLKVDCAIPEIYIDGQIEQIEAISKLAGSLLNMNDIPTRTRKPTVAQIEPATKTATTNSRLSVCTSITLQRMQFCLEDAQTVTLVISSVQFGNNDNVVRASLDGAIKLYYGRELVDNNMILRLGDDSIESSAVNLEMLLADDLVRGEMKVPSKIWFSVSDRWIWDLREIIVSVTNVLPKRDERHKLKDEPTESRPVKSVPLDIVLSAGGVCGKFEIGEIDDTWDVDKLTVQIAADGRVDIGVESIGLGNLLRNSSLRVSFDPTGPGITLVTESLEGSIDPRYARSLLSIYKPPVRVGATCMPLMAISVSVNTLDVNLYISETRSIPLKITGIVVKSDESHVNIIDLSTEKMSLSGFVDVQDIKLHVDLDLSLVCPAVKQGAEIAEPTSRLALGYKYVHGGATSLSIGRIELKYHRKEAQMICDFLSGSIRDMVFDHENPYEFFMSVNMQITDVSLDVYDIMRDMVGGLHMGQIVIDTDRNGMSAKVGMISGFDNNIRNVQSGVFLTITMNDEEIRVAVAPIEAIIDVALLSQMITVLCQSPFIHFAKARAIVTPKVERPPIDKKIVVCVDRSVIGTAVNKDICQEHAFFEFEMQCTMENNHVSLIIPCFSGYFAADARATRYIFIKPWSVQMSLSTDRENPVVDVATTETLELYVTAVDIALTSIMIKTVVPVVQKYLVVDWGIFSGAKKEKVSKPTAYNLTSPGLAVIVLRDNRNVKDPVQLLRLVITDTLFYITETQRIVQPSPVAIEVDVFNFTSNVFDVILEPTRILVGMEKQPHSVCLDVGTEGPVNFNFSLDATLTVMRFMEEMIDRINKNDVTGTPTADFSICNEIGMKTVVKISDQEYVMEKGQEISARSLTKDSIVRVQINGAACIRVSDLVYPMFVRKNIVVYHRTTLKKHQIILSSLVNIRNETGIVLSLIAQENNLDRRVLSIKKWQECRIPFFEQFDGIFRFVEDGASVIRKHSTSFTLSEAVTKKVFGINILTRRGIYNFIARVERDKASLVYCVTIEPVTIIENKLPYTLYVYGMDQVVKIKSGKCGSTHYIPLSTESVTLSMAVGDVPARKSCTIVIGELSKLHVDIGTNSAMLAIDSKKDEIVGQISITVYAPGIIYNMSKSRMCCHRHEFFGSLTEEPTLWGTHEYFGSDRQLNGDILYANGQNLTGVSVEFRVNETGILRVPKGKDLFVPFAYTCNSAEPFAPSCVVTFSDYLEVCNLLSFPIMFQPMLQDGLGFNCCGSVVRVEPGDNVCLDEASDGLIFGIFTEDCNLPTQISFASVVRTTLVLQSGLMIGVRIVEEGRNMRCMLTPASLPQPYMISNRTTEFNVFVSEPGAAKPIEVVPLSTSAIGFKDVSNVSNVLVTVGDDSCDVSFDDFNALYTIAASAEALVYVRVTFSSNGTRSIVVYKDEAMHLDYVESEEAFQFSFSLKTEQVCISLIDSYPQEIALIVMRGLSTTIQTDSEYVHIAVCMEMFTIEDQNHSAIHRVALLGKTENAPFCHLSATTYRKALFRRFDMLILQTGDIAVFADLSFVSDVHVFLENIIPGFASSNRKLDPINVSNSRTAVDRVPVSVAHLRVKGLTANVQSLNSKRDPFYQRSLHRLDKVPTIAAPVSIRLTSMDYDGVEFNARLVDRIREICLAQIRPQVVKIIGKSLKGLIRGVFSSGKRADVQCLRVARCFVDRHIRPFDCGISMLQDSIANAKVGQDGVDVAEKRPEMIESIFRSSNKLKMIALTTGMMFYESHAKNVVHLTVHYGDIVRIDHPSNQLGTIIIVTDKGVVAFECETVAISCKLERLLTSKRFMACAIRKKK